MLTPNPFKMPATNHAVTSVRDANPMDHNNLLLQAIKMLTACLSLKYKHLEIKTAVHCGASFSTLSQPPLFPSLAFVAAACDRNCILLATGFHMVFLNNILPYLRSASKPKDFFVLYKLLCDKPETATFI